MTFADTLYFVAALSPSDQYHAVAKRLTQEGIGPILTTQFILVEVGNFFAQPSLRPAFLSLVHRLSLAEDIEVLPRA